MNNFSRDFAVIAQERDELRAEVKQLQNALHFWLPFVPPKGPEEIAKRIGDDAMLLVGLEDVPDEKTAEELGWIRFSDSISGHSE